MKKHSIFLFIILISSVLSLYAQSYEGSNAQRLIPAGHWIYDSLIRIEAETGSVSFAQNAPLSAAEIKGYLSEIPRDALSSAAQNAITSILNFLDEKYPAISSKALSIGIDPSISLEFYHKQTDGVPWMYDNFYKKHLLDLPLFLSVGNYVFIESDIFAGINYWTAREDENFTNIPLNGDQLDSHFPSTAYISAGLPVFNIFSINFQLGQGKLSVGNTMLGSVFLSDHFESDAYAQLSFYSPNIRYASSTIQLEVNKYFYLHRLELKPIKQLQFGILEGVLVNAPFELRYLNPLTIFHSYAAWRSYEGYNQGQKDGDDNDYNGFSRVGSYFGLTFDANPWKYMRVYGLFAMNQFQTQYERETFPASATIPDSIGFQTGIQGYIPVKNGYLSGGIEFLYTNPWLYINDDAGWSFFRTRYDNIKNPDTPINSWLGSPYGPDTTGFAGKLGYEEANKWSVDLLYTYLNRGEQSFSMFSPFDGGKNSYYPSTVEEATLKTPTGIPEKTTMIQLSGSYNPLSWIEISIQLGYTYITGFNHTEGVNKYGIEAVVSTTIKLP